jgi:hypothetical protein
VTSRIGPTIHKAKSTLLKSMTSTTTFGRSPHEREVRSYESVVRTFKRHISGVKVPVVECVCRNTLGKNMTDVSEHNPMYS